MARVNYFESMQKQFGDNWIITQNPDSIQRSAKRIVKEMVHGNIDYQKYGNYFLDPKFMENLIIACRNELEVNTLLYTAVYHYAQQEPLYPNINIELNHLQALCYVYNVITQKLDYVKLYSNVGYLADIASLLYTYRHHLN
jgi:hypothetical protein